ncbi:MAG: TIGR03826 family flagellar region protein [Bacillus sp. (in: firmicutes)]
MGELMNCPNCKAVFIKTKFRDACEACLEKEDKQYEEVYAFIRKRENRTATIMQVVDMTGVEECLIIKFIKTGRLKLAQFPNLGYKCDRCGVIIREGKICYSCADELRRGLEAIRKEEELQKARLEREETYHVKGRQ